MDDLFSELRRVTHAGGSRAEQAGLAAEAIRASTGCRWVGIYSVERGTVTNEAWSGPGAPAHPTFSADQGLTSHALAAAAVAVSNHVSIDPRYLTNQADSGSELIVPILVGGTPRGTLDVEQGYAGAFNGASIAGYERIATLLTPLWER